MTRVFVALLPKNTTVCQQCQETASLWGPKQRHRCYTAYTKLKIYSGKTGSPSTHRECTISITPQKVLKQCAFQSYFRITQFFKVHNIKKNLLAQIPPLSRSLVWPSESTSVSLTAIPYISKEKIYFVYTFSLVSVSPQFTANSSY